MPAYRVPWGLKALVLATIAIVMLLKTPAERLAVIAGILDSGFGPENPESGNWTPAIPVLFGMDRYRSLSVAAALVAIALPIAACDIDVRKDESPDGKANVDITTPVGNVSVRTNVETPDTGLAVYPGATPLREEDEPESADVNVGNSFFGVKVLAAKFESTDAHERIIDFYRNELKAYGDVTECHGDVNYRRGRPVCREKFFSRGDLQLVAGPEDQQHIVSVKPRGEGTEFGLVYVQTRGEN